MVYSETNKEQIENIVKIFSGSPNTITVLDRTLRCIYSDNEKLVPKGTDMLQKIREKVVYPFKDCRSVSMMLNGEMYCARLMPQYEHFGDTTLYICEIIDSSNAWEIFRKTDISARFFPLLSSMERNIGLSWGVVSELKDKLENSRDYENLLLVYRLKSYLVDILSISKNFTGYFDMNGETREPVITDAVSLINGFVLRCNAALAKCGRHIELLCDSDRADILIDGRLAIAAFTSAVQNALLYSSRDTVPTILVYEAAEGKHRFVSIRITNEKAMYDEKDFENISNINFTYQRLGCGIPIIKRFAEKSGGRFEILEERGSFSATLSLPVVSDDYIGNIRRLSRSIDESVFYETDIPDYVQLKMYEVVKFFGELEQ